MGDVCGYGPMSRDISWFECFANMRIQVTSMFNLKVVRIEVENTHDQFRNSKQAEKAYLQLAVIHQDSSIESLSVKLLQKMQAEADEFYRDTTSLAPQNLFHRQGIYSRLLLPPIRMARLTRITRALK